MTVAFTLATALALGATGWEWIAGRQDLLAVLHNSVDPLMLAFLFAELAHTAQVMQSTHHIRPELIIILASLASARHLLVLLTVTRNPTLASMWGSAGVTTLFVVVWMAWSILSPRFTDEKSPDAENENAH
jgi:uncharacterized membrane protein (DUF373 family)